MTGARHPHTAPARQEAAPGIVVRASAVILDRRDMCLIHRRRPHGDHYSIPGGLVQAHEDIGHALARELKEELDLDLACLPEQPSLQWVQDQILTRPGSTSPFRRLHLVHRIHLPAGIRPTLAAIEQDDPEQPRIVWMDYHHAAELHLYPAVGSALSSMATPHSPSGSLLLPPITDHSYTWR